MNHNDIRHKLSEYIDDALTPDEKAAIHAHLATCAECSDALRELLKTIEQVKQLEEVEAPAWMTSKIMATVRDDVERRKSVFRQIFDFLVGGRSAGVVAVLFLTVTAYYIYTANHRAERYAEAPLPEIAGQKAPQPAAGAPEQNAPAIDGRREQKVEQAPGYRSLDMKDEYERPAPPAPSKTSEEPSVAGKAGSVAPRAMAAGTAAPTTMAQQEAGAARSPERKQSAARQDHLYEKELGESSGADREAEERLSVTEYFVSHDLQEAMKVRGLQFITRKVPDDLSGLEWLREMAAYRSVPCARRYIVDVDLAGRSLKYLYCCDRSTIRRLGVFELISGVWMEQK